MITEAQIVEQRQTWAKGKLTVAWLKLAKVVDNPRLTRAWLEVLEKDVVEARAIAEEWGLDCRALIEKLAAGDVESGTKAG